MEWIVKEFEREYSNGEPVLEVRKFVNRYVIQGGEHKRRQKENAKRQRILEKKLRLLEALLGQAK